MQIELMAKNLLYNDFKSSPLSLRFPLECVPPPIDPLNRLIKQN